MNPRPRIKPYREPGGGWGATIATGKVLLEQKVLFIGALALYHMNKPGGFRLANTASERIWMTPTGKANFIVFAGLDEDPHQNNLDVLWLSTLRSHDQYNSTIYSNSDRYRGVYNQRDVLFLNDKEIKRRGLAAEDRVDIQTMSSDGIERVVHGFKIVPYNIPDGSCAAYYPETNALLPLDLYHRLSGTPSAKGIPVLLKPVSATRV